MIYKRFVDNVFKKAYSHSFCTQLNGYKLCSVSLTIQ